ncbi:MAG: lipid-A-disaccharide synthase [Bacteroidales bacterium]|nr:lipid-A-disaccharide synthase [Bacteroidales bacterium]
MKYYLIAGEASGDLHGSNLIKGLHSEDPDCRIRYWGGSLMDRAWTAAGNPSNLVRDYREGAVMGFVDVLKKARRLSLNLKMCREDILRFAPDVVVLIDYPGFNLKIARFAHSRGIKVFYYIAPKVWASREGRIRKIKAWVDRLFIVFPFEKPYFDGKGIDYTYAGNPLVDAVDSSEQVHISREEFFKANGIPEGRYIALLAGSRKSEISYMMPVFAAFADTLRSIPQYSDIQFIIAGAPSRSEEDYRRWTEGRESYMHILFGNTYGILRHAESAVINSGTASLEAALIGTPQVVGFATGKLSYMIGRRLIKVKFISLGNLILGRRAFREFLQYYFTPGNLVDETRRIMEDTLYRDGMKACYSEIRALLGGGGASRRVAAAMVRELNTPAPRK